MGPRLGNDQKAAIAAFCFRVSSGNSGDTPEIDLERFLSMIRFDSRQKLDDLPDFQLDS